MTVNNTSSVLKYLQHFWHACGVHSDEGVAEDSCSDTEKSPPPHTKIPKFPTMAGRPLRKTISSDTLELYKIFKSIYFGLASLHSSQSK